ncbi:hypothetical protein [Pedobacter caeni]|uniref:Uncharacterized protein n=1 Tax=Pedobacter caeni TaxID=288992 RepID=A0A1M4V8X5_9SPHI|nr:hypothetical protein [Pedobacter caeni]SHE65446.1 hypothetical protein SAMN04488522_101823 [Pedobacter caeni]
MKENNLNVGVFTASLLNKVNQPILNWDLGAKTGKGFFSTHHSCAYLELKIYKAVSEKYEYSKVIWNAPDTEIIKYHESYKSEVENALIFFTKYISALRGESIELTFEVNDATFDFTSHRFNPFEKAAIYAIINCFDGEEEPKYRQGNIQTLKGNLKRQFEYDTQLRK